MLSISYRGAAALCLSVQGCSSLFQPLTISIQANPLKMVQIPSLTQALSLAALLPTLAAASPARRGLDELQSMIDGTSDVVLNPGYPWEGGYEHLFVDYYNSQADCVADMPKGLGPTVSPDTPAAFTGNTVFANNARTFGVSNSTYTVVAFNTLGAAIANSTLDPSPIGYMGWLNMPSYTPYACSQICNNLVTKAGAACNSYNIYYLRSPTVAPAASCASPASM